MCKYTLEFTNVGVEINKIKYAPQFYLHTLVKSSYL